MKTLRITLLLLISSFCIKLYGQSEPLQYKCDTIITVANNIQKGQIRLAPAIGGFLNLNISENDSFEIDDSFYELLKKDADFDYKLYELTNIHIVSISKI